MNVPNKILHKDMVVLSKHHRYNVNITSDNDGVTENDRKKAWAT